ncbi:Sulfite exporter TauE/SafE [compost metagenome]
MALAAILANFSRVIAWWREIDWKAWAAYSITGVPAAAIGARTLWTLPASFIDIALGIFFLLMIPVRHWIDAKKWQIRLWQLSAAGGIIGFLTGVVLSTGPLSVPAFTAYGLTKGAFLSTEAASSFALYISKAVTFRELGALPAEVILKGAIVGSSLMAGTFLAKQLVQRMSVTTYRFALDFLLFVSGISLLWTTAVH